MREVIIDFKELTDSREMYQAKPHPFIWVFTYILIALISAALVWSFFGKKEIVVKASGKVRPELGISTVKNSLGGEVESVSFRQGQTVKKGEILFIVKHDGLLLEKESNNEQLQENEKELENLQKYRRSVTSGVNEFDAKTETMFYEKVRKLLMDIQYSQSDTNYRITKLQEQKNINSQQLMDYQREIEYLNKYINSLDKNISSFSKDNEKERLFAQKFEKYLISCQDIQRKYDQLSNEIKSNSFSALNKTLKEEKALLTAYDTLKKCINSGKNVFTLGDTYISLYTDYEFKVKNLKNTYDEQKRIYDAYVALSGIAVTKSQLEDAKIQLDKAEGDYYTFKANFLTELNNKITNQQIKVEEFESRISGTMDEKSLLELNRKDRENAVKRLYLDERQVATDSVEKLKDTVNTLRLSIKLDEAELQTITDSTKDTQLIYSLVERTKSQEIVTCDEKIKQVNDTINTIRQNLKKIQLDIDNAIVKANIDGTVNILSEIYTGDLVEPGKNILTLIPDNDSAFTMQIYVNNKDIGEIHTGDKVKYSFAALPYREYGQLTGTIISISKDTVTNDTSGQSFYLVEATVPAARLVSNSGKQGDIKVGMLCEANVITKQRSFLRYFLEKINFLD